MSFNVLLGVKDDRIIIEFDREVKWVAFSIEEAIKIQRILAEQILLLTGAANNERH